MSRWKRVLRGMLGTTLTFGAAGAVVFGVIAVVLAIFFPGAEDDLGFVVVAGTVWGGAIGAAFSGALAIAARGRTLDELSLPRVAAVGAGGGLILAAFLVGALLEPWSLRDAMVPLTFLPLFGAGSGVASLLLARKAEPALGPAEGSPSGDPERLEPVRREDSTPSPP